MGQPIAGVNIVLTGQNKLLNNMSVIKGRYKEAHLLFDPNYSVPEVEIPPVIVDFFNIHKESVDYNDKTSVQKKMVTELKNTFSYQ